MYLVCVCCCWERRLSWYLLEYLLIQKHLWLLIDSICFVQVVCALQHGTEFMCKGRMAGQVPGQWESSLRTKTGTCPYPFRSQHAEALHEEWSKIVGITVPFGWGAGTSYPTACQQERNFLDWIFSLVGFFLCIYIYTYIFWICSFWTSSLKWEKCNNFEGLGRCYNLPSSFNRCKTTPRKRKWLDQVPMGRWQPMCLGKITHTSQRFSIGYGKDEVPCHNVALSSILGF